MRAWMDGLTADELRELIEAMIDQVPAVEPLIAAEQDNVPYGPDSLMVTVNETLAPTRGFYDWRGADEYAAGCEPTIELLQEAARHATPALIPVIERAITLTTRTIMRSDDSSGLQGSQIMALLSSHARAVRSSNPPLSQSEQTRLIKWILKYRYGGKQDYFDPDIVAYAPALSGKSIERYRAAISSIDLGEYGQFPLRRLAVLDRDRAAIVAANGGEPMNSGRAGFIVDDLEEAGLHEDALYYAQIGVNMDNRGWDRRLIDFLVEDRTSRGDFAGALTLVRDWFLRFPNSSAFIALRSAAKVQNVWDEKRESAEALVSQRDPTFFVGDLLDQDRIDEAWEFALETEPSMPTDSWMRLCEARAVAHPSETLPIYQDLVDSTLITADKRSYQSAAKILKQMRKVAGRAGSQGPDQFLRFLERTVENNRRRPNCMKIFERAGLLKFNR